METNTSLPLQQPGVKPPNLALVYKARSGVNQIVWRQAPTDIGIIDTEIATVWNIHHIAGLRAVIAQMLAGPALYAAAVRFLGPGTDGAGEALAQAIVAAEHLVVECEVTE